MSLDATLDRSDVVLLRLARSRAAKLRRKARDAAVPEAAPKARRPRGNRGLGRRHMQLIEVRIALVRAAKREKTEAGKAPFLKTKELDRMFGIGG